MFTILVAPFKFIGMQKDDRFIFVRSVYEQGDLQICSFQFSKDDASSPLSVQYVKTTMQSTAVFSVQRGATDYLLLLQISNGFV